MFFSFCHLLGQEIFSLVALLQLFLAFRVALFVFLELFVVVVVVSQMPHMMIMSQEPVLGVVVERMVVSVVSIRGEASGV